MVPGGCIGVRILDVSMGGVSLACSVNLPAGGSCRIDTVIPASGGRIFPVQWNAKVVSSVLSTQHGFRIGMMFTDLSPEGRMALEDCMAP